jgi:hypothetical protein
MDERTRRVGLNEAVFREINQQLEELNDRFAADSERLVIVCECGDETCAERIELLPSEYESLRSDATHFAVVPGHEISDLEKVVAERPGYNVVEKRPGSPALIAITTDR